MNMRGRALIGFGMMQVQALSATLWPTNPTAEVADSKSVKSRFKSEVGYLLFKGVTV